MGSFLRKDKDLIKQDLEYMFELFPRLAERRTQQGGTLSGGEQQMLAMARALTVNPKLLMVDEMSLGLAPIIVERLLPILRTIADETGAGVLLVEQHVHMALQVADRGYVIERGVLVAHGSSKLLARSSVIQEAYLGAAASDTRTASQAFEKTVRST